MELRTGLEDKPWWVSAIAGIVIGGLLYGAAFYWFVRPSNERYAHQGRVLSDLQTKIQEGRAAQQELPRFREQVRELQLELDRLLRILPARRNTPELLRRIRDLTRQGDFNLRRFTPGIFIDREFYSEWPIAVSLEGTYHNLALLFDRIGRFSRIINIEGLRVDTLRRGRPSHTLTANFTAKTFVYKEPPPLEGAQP